VAELQDWDSYQFPFLYSIVLLFGAKLESSFNSMATKKKKSPNKTCQMLNKQLKCQIFIIMGRKKTIAQSMKAMTDVWSFDPSISGEDIFSPK
jgi:hypothetical protein